MNSPLVLQRHLLRFKSVLIQCLDEVGKPLAGTNASGFIRREGGCYFLYTCWHVVTGYDPYDVQVGNSLPARRALRISSQAAVSPQPGLEAIGGIHTFDVRLYAGAATPLRPLWHQDDQHVPNIDLNNIGLHVPFWHDVIKLELPIDLPLSTEQIIDESRLIDSAMLHTSAGDKCVIVGYPYGFSAAGPNEPTPVALTRFAASDSVPGRHQAFLLESIAAPGMSGGPVFLEREDELRLVGIYTGAFFPNGPRREYVARQTTDLGIVSDLSLVLWNMWPLVQNPSRALER
jgi:hypothetical protein